MKVLALGSKVLVLEDLPERQAAFRQAFSAHNLVVVTSVVAAKYQLSRDDIQFDLICLDHDLDGRNGVPLDDSNCGSRVAEFIRDNHINSRVVIHSLNPAGSANMKSILPDAEVAPGFWSTYGEELKKMSVEESKEMIQNFEDKKLSEYLVPGGKYLIRFGHGLGDTIMFMPIYDKLVELYTDCQIDLYVESGQEEIWESVPDKDASGYDEIFSLHFPMAIGSDITKPAKCCIDEVGIEPITGLAKLPAKPSPLIGVHYHGTALPGSVGCPDRVAQEIWNEILEFGRIPIECHFEHLFHNPANKKFWFISNHVRNCTANLHNLLGLIQHLGAFIGVASGPWVAALSYMPERTLYLEKDHKLETYTDISAASVDILNYRSGSITQWLGSLEW